MQRTRLVSAVIFGVLIFGEPLTFGKVLGTLVFCIAFSLTDKTTWGIVYDFFKFRFYLT